MSAPSRCIRRERRARGAALVEAVAAIPFFLVAFACSLYVAHLYGEKLRTMRDARQAAWTYAMHDCTGSGASTSPDGSTPLGDLGGGSDPNLYNGDAIGAGSFTKEWGTAVATAESQASASRIIGGFSKKLATTTRVQCNETPHDGDPLGMLRFAWGSLTSF